MNIARNQDSFLTQPTHRILAFTFATLVGMVPFVAAQTPLPDKPSTDVIATNVHLDLPDSPGVLFSPSSSSMDIATSPAAPDDASDGQTSTAAPPKKHAPHLKMTIAPDEIADPMTVKEKVVGGLIDSVSFFAATGWIAAAGWEQLWNDSPNYGTDAGAFGQRLGAATIRGISEGVLSESFFAPTLS